MRKYILLTTKTGIRRTHQGNQITMKLDQNICIVPDCKEIQLLLERGCVFCIEHRKRFDDFLVRNPVSSEIDYFLKKDKEFRNEF